MAWLARRLPEVYLLVALFVCVLLALLTAPFNTPDEPNHAQREVQLARGGIIARRTPQGVGGTIDSSLHSFAVTTTSLRNAYVALHPDPPFPPGRISPADLVQLQAMRWSRSPVFATFENTAVYPPGLYLPQTLGWRIGETAHFTLVQSMMLARLCAAVCAIALGWLALRLAGPERWLLFPYLLLPTGLSLAASCSQDALIATITALLAVLLLRPIAARRPQTLAELAVSCCLLTLIIGARLTYLPLVLVLLLPAIEAPGIVWRTLLRPLAAASLAVLAVGIWQAMVHHLGTLVRSGCDASLQAAMLEHHPAAGFISLLDAIFKLIPVMLIKGLYMLGTNDVGPPHAIYATMVIAMAAFVALHPLSGLRTATGRLLLAISLAGMVVATWLAEYLLWTPVGLHHVEGLQARYFLPAIPLALLFGWPDLLQKLLAPRPGLRSKLTLATAAIFVPAVLYAPWAVAHAFYLQGVFQALPGVLR